MGQTLERLVEEASQRLEIGEPIDLESLCAAHPEHAKELRELLPAVAMLFNLGAAPIEKGINGAQAAPPYARLGDFRLIREIGHGGMGTVYEAEQISLGRRVALKVLPFAGVLDKQQLARFQNEARAAATLDHPNIVAVHSVGSDRGMHFYTMQLIESRSLAEAIEGMRNSECGVRNEDKKRFVKQSPSPSPSPADGGGGSGKSEIRNPQSAITTGATGSSRYYRSVAELGIQVARALEHAHAHGVLHRDVKPANLLLDRDGKLWVTDFGLARICSEAGLTTTGDMLGTLRYMSPEQVSAKAGVVDHRSDIYSLGATLYELLALTPAYEGDDRPVLLRQIALDEPRRLRQRDWRIPVDLETIVGKSMEKDPASRYATARELADDLERFVAHQPILARPATYVDRLVKWSRRHQSLVATAGLAICLLIVVLAVSIGMVNRARVRALASLEETADLLYVSDMSAAYQAWEKGWSDEAYEILERHRPKHDEPDRRGFEWHLLNSAVQPPAAVELAGHKGAVNELAVFPDRQRLASVGDDGTLRIWDVRSHKLQKTLKLCDRPLHAVAVSDDGRYVACGSEGPLVNAKNGDDPATVYLCDVQDDCSVKEFFHCDHTIESLAFRYDGNAIAVGSRYDRVYLVALNGIVIQSMECKSRVQSLEFFPGDSQLIVPNRVPPGTHGIVQILGEDARTIQAEFRGVPEGKSSNVTVARPSPCGKYIVAGRTYDSEATILERSSGKVLTTTPASRGRLIDVAYAPNGKAIALGYENGVVECFRIERRTEGEVAINDRLIVTRSHRGSVNSLKFVNAETLATCGADGLVKICRYYHVAKEFHNLGPSMDSLQFSPDGQLLAYMHIQGCGTFEASRNEMISDVRLSTDPQGGLAWSPSGEELAICVETKDENSVQFLNRQGQPARTLPHAGDLNAIAYSPDGQLLAAIGDPQLQILRADVGQVVHRRALTGKGRAVTFSHTGDLLVYSVHPAKVVLMSTADFQLKVELHRFGGADCFAFSSDDSVLATGHRDGVIQLWDVGTGRLRAELVGHQLAVRDLAFSPDDRTLLSAAIDGTVRLWSVEHGRSFGVFHRADGYCRLSLSPDGRRLAIGNHRVAGRDVHVWEIPPPKSSDESTAF